MAVVIALAAIAARAWIAWRSHSTAEDFLITLRYAENIAAGRGFVYNPGERVLGTTTPLYTLILASAARIGCDAAAVGKALNIVAEGVTCYLIFHIAALRQFHRPVAGLFAATLYAFGRLPISVSISGMETALVTCCGTAAIYAYLARRPLFLYVSGSLLLLFRIDGGVLFGLLAVALIIRERRVPWRPCAVSSMILLPWIVFASLYFSSPIPQSVHSKLLVYSHPLMQKWFGTQAVKRQVFSDVFGGPRTGLITALFVVGVAGAFWAAARQIYRTMSPVRAARSEPPAKVVGPRVLAHLTVPLLWLLIYYGTIYFSTVLAFPWYFLPPWPLFCLTAALAAAVIAERAGHWAEGIRPGLPQTASLGALAVLATLLVSRLPPLQESATAYQLFEDHFRKVAGLWLHDHVGPDERVLVEPIGYCGYYSNRRVLDMVGLVSPEVLPSYSNANFLAAIVERLEPEWLCLRPLELEKLAEAGPRLMSNYELVTEIRSPERGESFEIYRRVTIVTAANSPRGPRIRAMAGRWLTGLSVTSSASATSHRRQPCSLRCSACSLHHSRKSRSLAGILYYTPWRLRENLCATVSKSGLASERISLVCGYLHDRAGLFVGARPRGWEWRTDERRDRISQSCMEPGSWAWILIRLG